MENLNVILGILGTALGFALSYAAFTRNMKKDSEAEGKESGAVLTELGYIKSGIDDLKNENREQHKTNLDILTTLTAVESSAKQAHKRIDRLEGKEAWPK